MTLFQPEFGLMFWMLVAFLIVLGILAKFAWPSIIKGIEKRADFIDEGVRYTQDAIERKKQAEEEAQTLLSETRRQQTEILRESEELKQRMMSEARASAVAERQKIIEVAKQSADQIKKEAELYIRNKIVMLSLQMAEKVLRKELENPKEQEKMIEKYLDEMGY